MAILIDPGNDVLAASIAPEIRLPWVTVGVESEAESYVMLSWMPETPSIPEPCTEYDLSPEDETDTEAAAKTEVDHDNSNIDAANSTLVDDDRNMRISLNSFV